MRSIHHSFDIELAAQYSVEEAILIHHFQFWIYQNKRLNRNFKEGRTWTYQTLEEIAAIFPYWSKDQVRDLLYKLVTEKVRKTENKAHEPILLCKNYYDRTKWYAFINEIYFIGKSPRLNPQMEKGISPNGKRDIPTPIPDTKPDTKTSIINNTPIIASNSEITLSKPDFDINYDFIKHDFINITEQDKLSWKKLYPSIDLEIELLKAIEWIKSEPTKAKHKKKWRSFLRNWFSRANERASNKEAFRSMREKERTHPPSSGSPPSLKDQEEEVLNELYNSYYSWFNGKKANDAYWQDKVGFLVLKPNYFEVYNKEVKFQRSLKKFYHLLTTEYADESFYNSCKPLMEKAKKMIGDL